jgi:hypothetical protein
VQRAWFNGSMVQWFNGSMVQWFNGSMVQWFNEMRRANFSNIQEVRGVFPHADKVGKFTVFNI